MANRGRRTAAILLGNLIVAMSAIAINLATADNELLALVHPYRTWAWVLVVLLVVVSAIYTIRMDGNKDAPNRTEQLWISNLKARNPNFMNRRELLDYLHSGLTTAAPRRWSIKLLKGSRSVPVPVPQVLFGLPGVGKTQTALEYAHRFADDYDIRWWVEAEQTPAISAALAELAQEMGISDTVNQNTDNPRELDQARLIRRLFGELGRRDRWLLIFDNAEVSQDFYRLQPSGGRGHILITSTDALWEELVEDSRMFSVEPLPRDEAVSFLTKRTGDNDEETARTLAEELGDLPLALEHAAAYMKQTGTGLKRYLRRFRNDRDFLLRKSKSVLHPSTVESTFRLALGKATKEEPSAASALQLLAAFAAQPIPRTVLTDKAVDEDATGVLHRFSLIQQDNHGNEIWMHRLVKTVTRGSGIGGSPEDATRQAVRLLLEKWPKSLDDRESVLRCGQLLPHALVLEEESRTLDPPPREMGELLDRVARYLRSRGQLENAELLATRAVAVKEKSFGPQDPAVAKSLVVLAWVLRQGGHMRQAQVELEKALRILGAALSPNHPEAAAVLDELGIVLRRKGEPTKAREMHQLALNIRMAWFGPAHSAVGHTLRNLAAVERDLGDLLSARHRLEEALGIFELKYGRGHPEVATMQDNLGIVLRRLGQPRQAEAVHRQALITRENIYGRDHPEIACTIRNLGFVALDLDNVDEACARFEEALRIVEAGYGSDSPDAASTLDCLGIALRRQGKYPLAREMHEQALASREARFGGQHPDVAATLCNLAIVLRHLGRLDDAEQRLNTAIEIFEAAYGPEHPDVAMALDELGNVWFRRGDTKKARELQERALSIREARFGASHPDVAEILDHLADTLDRSGDHPAARLHRQRAKTIRAGVVR